MSDDFVSLKEKFDAVTTELDVAIALLKEACGKERAQFIEESIYIVLGNLVVALAPDLNNQDGSRLN